jgi:peptidoglycan/LPS O-acetylase OafA/YrhL
MICSLLLPFLHWAASRLSAFWNGLLLLALVFLGIPFSHTGSFVYMFFAGYLLPFAGPRLLSQLRPTVLQYAWILGGAALLLLCSRLCLGPGILILKAGYLTECLGATIIIAALLYGPELKVFRFLDFPIVRFYGRISYSFYLWHCFCLFLVWRVAFRQMPIPLTGGFPMTCEAVGWFLSTLLATTIAYVSYRAIELPNIRFAKAICSKMRARVRARHAVNFPIK